MSSLASRIEDALKLACDVQGIQAMHMLLDLASGIDDDDGETVIDDHPELRVKYGPKVTSIYQQYIFDYESAARKKLTNLMGVHACSFKDATTFLGNAAYDRANEIYDHVVFDDTKKFVIVGCGQLPFTAFHAHDHTRNAEIVAIDICDDAIESVNQLAFHFKMDRLKAQKATGENFDYDQAGIVYIANMVSPKSDVLKRIAMTSSTDVRVVLRDPYSIGRLWSERGIDALHPHFAVTGYGEGANYKSRHVFLQRM